MIKRESYMKRIRPFIDSDLVKVMTGIRRSGKSVMLQLVQDELLRRGVQKDQIISINFEDLKYADLHTYMALNGEIQKRIQAVRGKVYLFFDEIQEVEGWEKCINSFRASLNCDIYLTGSNAKLLSGELATYLGGRYVEFVIYPFSFAEFKELYRSVEPDTSEAKAFQQYLLMGGMPYLANLDYKEEPCRQYLMNLFNSVQLKDIVQRNNIRDADLLKRVISYVIANVGNTFSATSIHKYLKNEHRSSTGDTILNYIDYCCDAYLFYRVKREDIQGKQLLSTNEKYYLADHGVREAVFGENMKDINLILENLVFMEALRRGYDITVGRAGNQEIDFILRKREDKIYIQVTYLLASEETIDREFGVYNAISDNYPKYVVSMDEINLSRNGIKHMNIREFLQSEWG